MSKKYAYISTSVDTPNSVIEDAKLFLYGLDIPQKMWDRGSIYTSDLVDNASAIILLLDKSVSTTYIGKGSFSELEIAKHKRIPVFILYKRASDNTFNFYYLEDFYRGGENFSRWGVVNFGSLCYEAPLQDIIGAIEYEPLKLEVESEPVNTENLITLDSLVVMSNKDFLKCLIFFVNPN